MMKKTTKIKPEERTPLVEFLVTKRVKYLEYLKDIHSDEGGLWMNTIYVSRQYLGRYFGVPADCLAQNVAGAGGAAAEPETAGLVRIPLDTNYEPGGKRSFDTGAPSSAAGTDDEEYTYVPLDKLPNPASVGRDSSISEWHKRYLPGYVALAMALSDLLLVPVSGEEFLECVYHLLLEVDVAFGGSVAAKALAQRSLRTLRMHPSQALTAALTASVDEGTGDAGAEGLLAALDSPTPGLANQSGAAAAANTASSEQFKYIFLQSRHLAYTAGAPAYDTVMPALFSSLIFAYRRLCDYELTSREDCVKRILSIDKHLEKLVFSRVGKELEKAAKLKLVREAYLLSPRGLFTEVGGGEAEADFINDIVAAAAQKSETQQKGGAAAAPGAAGGDGDEVGDSSAESDDAADME